MVTIEDSQPTEAPNKTPLGTLVGFNRSYNQGFFATSEAKAKQMAEDTALDVAMSVKNAYNLFKSNYGLCSLMSDNPRVRVLLTLLNPS